jgi:HAD superfamily hydrolase (TIGR01490 family)
MTGTRPAALFDFDFTLLRGESLSLFLQFATRRFQRALLDLPRLGARMIPYLLGKYTKTQMKTEVLRILRHVPEEERPVLVAAFLEHILKPRLFPAGREKIRWHREKGHTLILATASPDTYMEPVRKLLQFEALVGTRTRPTGPNNAPVVVGANCYGEEKVRRMAELDFFESTDWAASYAYSDHPSDLPMLLLCGHRVATNPNRSLRKMAHREGWEIVDWS